MSDLPAKPPLRVWKLPPMWGAPSPSPFVVKLETWLRMANVPYEVAHLRRPPRSKTGKIPYVTLPSGEVLSDSSLIIERLSADREIDLDAGLDAHQRAVGHAVRRMVEEGMYFIGLYERWVGVGYAHSARDYFAYLPAPLRFVLPKLIHARMRRATHGQGVGRLSDEERLSKAEADIAAIAAILGDNDYILGPRPSNVDATVFGFAWTMSSNPYASSPGDAIKSDARMRRYFDRMKARYWNEWTPADG